MTTSLVFDKPAYRPGETINFRVSTSEVMHDLVVYGTGATRNGLTLPGQSTAETWGLWGNPTGTGYLVRPVADTPGSFTAIPISPAPATSVSFVGALVTALGVRVSYSGVATVVQAPALVHGVTPDTLNGQTGLDAHLKAWSDSHITRAYGAVGDGVPGWDRWDVAPHVAAGREVWFSFKDLDVAGVVAHMKAAPPGTYPIWYTPRHEANRPKSSTGALYVTAAELLTFGAQLKTAMAALPAPLRARIHVGPNFSGFPVAAGNEGVGWQDFVPAGHPWDFVSLDRYNDNPTKLHDPADFARMLIDMCHLTGLPGLVGEWGVQPGGYTDPQAGAWCAAVAKAWADSGVVVRAVYWCSHAGTNPSYHTEGRPAVTAAVHALL